MDVQLIYREPDGSHTLLGIRQMDEIPPIGKSFELDRRQYHAKSFGGPDAEGRFHLFLEDEPENLRY